MGFFERGASGWVRATIVLAALHAPALARPAIAAPIAPGSMGSRAACEAALALEERGDGRVSSRQPCHSAFIVDGAPEDMRNEVASMMSPSAHPSLDDLALATLIADAAIRRAADQPWGYLARCDIARRLGSADVMQTCLADLRRVAPGHPMTTHALDVAAERASWATWILRVLGLFALFGTLADAAQRRRRASHRRASAPAKLIPLLLVAVCSVLAGLGAGVAHAEPVPGREQLSELKIDDANPEASLPSVEMQNSRPLEFGYYLQDLAAKAERAAKSGDHAAEARFYRALTQAAPTASFGPRKLCEALEASGDTVNAVVACRTVLTRQGSTAGDYLRFVRIVLATPGQLSRGERSELDAVITHLAGEAQLGAVPTMLRCEVALRIQDLDALGDCTTELSKTAPNDPKTVSFEWALALRKNDRSAAIRLIDRARGVGMGDDGVAKMEEATRQMTRRRLGRLALLALSAMFVAALLALGFRRLAQRRRLAV